MASFHAKPGKTKSFYINIATTKLIIMEELKIVSDVMLEIANKSVQIKKELSFGGKNHES